MTQRCPRGSQRGVRGRRAPEQRRPIEAVDQHGRQASGAGSLSSWDDPDAMQEQRGERGSRPSSDVSKRAKWPTDARKRRSWRSKIPAGHTWNSGSPCSELRTISSGEPRPSRKAPVPRTLAPYERRSNARASLRTYTFASFHDCSKLFFFFFCQECRT